MAGAVLNATETVTSVVVCDEIIRVSSSDGTYSATPTRSVDPSIALSSPITVVVAPEAAARIASAAATPS